LSPATCRTVCESFGQECVGAIDNPDAELCGAMTWLRPEPCLARNTIPHRFMKAGGPANAWRSAAGDGSLLVLEGV
jgi:hypothetical protein